MELVTHGLKNDNPQYPYKRVQRKRSKDFKLPENTVCVNRPTKWGNPFKLVGGVIYVDAGHRRK